MHGPSALRFCSTSACTLLVLANLIVLPMRPDVEPWQLTCLQLDMRMRPIRGPGKMARPGGLSRHNMMCRSAPTLTLHLQNWLRQMKQPEAASISMPNAHRLACKNALHASIRNGPSRAMLHVPVSGLSWQGAVLAACNRKGLLHLQSAASVQPRDRQADWAHTAEELCMSIKRSQTPPADRSI